MKKSLQYPLNPRLVVKMLLTTYLLLSFNSKEFLPGDAVEVECVVAHSPCNGALLRCGWGLVGLALDAQVHDVVPADGAVVHNDVPCPQGNSVPFLNLKPVVEKSIRLRYSLIRTILKKNSTLRWRKTQIRKTQENSFLKQFQWYVYP